MYFLHLLFKLCLVVCVSDVLAPRFALLVAKRVVLAWTIAVVKAALESMVVLGTRNQTPFRPFCIFELPQTSLYIFFIFFLPKKWLKFKAAGILLLFFFSLFLFFTSGPFVKIGCFMVNILLVDKTVPKFTLWQLETKNASTSLV